MYTVFKLFGSRNIPAELTGKNIHRLENVLTLTRNMHRAFDDLDIWFEPKVCETAWVFNYSIDDAPFRWTAVQMNTEFAPQTPCISPLVPDRPVEWSRSSCQGVSTKQKLDVRSYPLHPGIISTSMLHAAKWHISRELPNTLNVATGPMRS